jgi:hypothetical protein
MHRTYFASFFVAVCLGCATTAEHQALVRPLPEDAPAAPYPQLLTRARAQAIAATEALYVEDWSECEEAGKALEQTARFLNKATEVPTDQKDNLPVVSGDLGKEAATFREMVRVKDGDKANEVLGRINHKLRRLKLKN